MPDAHFAGAVVVSVVLLVIVVQAIRLARLALVQRTLRRVLEAGIELRPELLAQAFDRPSDRSRGAIDMRNGLLLVAVGAATATAGLVQGQQETIRLALGIAAFPALVGIVLAGYGLVVVQRSRN